MRSMVARSVVWGACLTVGLMVLTKPSRAANCALYARAETGVELFGAAGGWWDQAEGRYERGHVPAVGAILVFRRTGQIPSGHVAVVARIINAPSGTHGRDYPTYGFVYPERGPREIGEIPNQNEHGSYLAETRDVADVS